jgi:hypothetical protein
MAAGDVGFRLARGQLGDILVSPGVTAAIEALGNDLAAAVRAQGRTVRSGAAVPVRVYTGTTDRAIATVVVAHPAGLALQAKHGILTRAASSIGLSVVSRRR